VVYDDSEPASSRERERGREGDGSSREASPSRRPHRRPHRRRGGASSPLLSGASREFTVSLEDDDNAVYYPIGAQASVRVWVRLESGPRTEARLGHEVSAGWVSSFSRGLWGGHALLLSTSVLHPV
jgi:hypothetical protein